MRQEALQQIIDQLQTLADKAKALKSFFGDLTESGEPIFDISKEVPGRDLNYADCLTRLLKIAGMAKGMAAAEKAIMTPISRLTQLKTAISNVESRIDEIESRFNSIRNSYGGINSFDYSNFHIFGNNSQNQNFLPLFENFVDATEIILEQFYVVFVYVQPHKYKISFGNISNTLSEILQEEASKFQYFDQSAKKADNIYKDLEFILENAKSNIQNIEANSSESRNFKNKLNSIYQESIATKKEVDEILENASLLEKQVMDFRGQFGRFDQELCDRLTKLRDGSAKQTELFANFDSKTEQVSNLIEKSESMLTGATAAGLASSFATARDALDQQLVD